MPASVAPSSTSLPTRQFGRYELRRLLGKSDQTMCWLALDTRTDLEAMLTLPRVQPGSAAAETAWVMAARRAARLDHPDLARVSACDVHDHWPYVAVERRLGVTLGEWLAQHPRPLPDDAAGWIASVLRGLAYAHEAGVAHHDLQSHAILVDDRGQALAMALSVAIEPPAEGERTRGHDRQMVVDTGVLRDQRAAAERDVLAAGLLLHRLLAGTPALDSDDTRRVMARMAPEGREFVRLPWTTPHPVPEALRAIVNRSSAGQARLRYHSARTFLDALVGWRDSAADDDGGPVALLLDRLRTVGHLPALPGLAQRVQRVTSIETQRTHDIARHLLPDLALSLELLRTYNSAQVQGTQVPGNGAVLTLRRVVALIGVNGVREAANALRSWPGPLDETGERALRRAVDRVRLAGHLGQALRPAGYDAEVVYLVTALQNLGRLLLRYHFADEATQIAQLMQPQPGADGRELPGLDEAAAGYAVLGVEVEAFSHAVARHWGFGDEVMHMIRRLPADAAVRRPDGDADTLRLVAACANETVDAVSDLPADKVGAALARTAQRYSRVLRLDAKGLLAALHEARDAVKTGLAPVGGGTSLEGTQDGTGRGPDAEAAGGRPESPEASSSAAPSAARDASFSAGS